MTFQFLLKGLVLGFAIAAPVGPIGILCIRRSLAEGQSAGLATGLGAATADALYGCVAAFGLTAISSFLVQQRFWLGLIGGGFLCFLGVRTFFSRPPEAATETIRTNLTTAYLSAFVLTITNPMTILSFVAVFAGLGLIGSSSYVDALALVAGVFAGSAAWWFLLSGGAALLRRRVGPSLMLLLKKGSGAIIFALGLYSVVGLLR